MQENFFVKSHGLGNDYIVLDEDYLGFSLDTKAIKLICDYHFGIGSDGILLRTASEKADFGLRIFNPDGSEAEKSGNGLRIFSKFLYDYGYTQEHGFTIETLGGLVTSEILECKNGKAFMVKVAIGQAEFLPANIPVNLDAPLCMDFPLQIEDRNLLINCVSVGNPHCVIFVDEWSAEDTHKYGPFIENHPLFPNRINVQFVKVMDSRTIEISIWERGAGYTFASGSSSSAAASMAYKKGLVSSPDIKVLMPGGELNVSIAADFQVQLTGEVRQVAEGVLHPELIEVFA